MQKREVKMLFFFIKDCDLYPSLLESHDLYPFVLDSSVMVECTKCSRRIDAEDFDKHVREVHSDAEKAKSAAASSTCSFCARVLTKEEYLTHFKVSEQLVLT